MTRAEHARRIGALSEADRWFDCSPRCGPPPRCRVLSRALVLASARRNDAVRAEIDAMSAKGTLPDSLTVRLASQIYDAELAVAALDRLDATGDVDTTGEISCCGPRCELFRGDTAGAAGSTGNRHSWFEDTLGRAAARFRPCRLATASTLRCCTPPCADTAEPARRPRDSLATCEHLRALSYPELGADVEVALRQRWQHSIAQFAAVAERLVADLSRLPPDEADTIWTAFDDADSRLAEVEHELDVAHPGIWFDAAVPDSVVRRGPTARAASPRAPFCSSISPSPTTSWPGQSPARMCDPSSTPSTPVSWPRRCGRSISDAVTAMPRPPG